MTELLKELDKDIDPVIDQQSRVSLILIEPKMDLDDGEPVLDSDRDGGDG